MDTDTVTDTVLVTDTDTVLDNAVTMVDTPLTDMVDTVVHTDTDTTTARGPLMPNPLLKPHPRPMLKPLLTMVDLTDTDTAVVTDTVDTEDTEDTEDTMA